MVAYKKLGSQVLPKPLPQPQTYVRINADSILPLMKKAAFGSRSWKMATQKQLSSGNGSATADEFNRIYELLGVEFWQSKW